MMFQKIMVPVDLTDRHSSALNVVSQMVSETEGEVVVLHLIEVLHGLSREEDPAFYRRLETKAKEHVARQVDVLRKKTVKARGEVLYGNRVGEIIGFARREGAHVACGRSDTVMDRLEHHLELSNRTAGSVPGAPCEITHTSFGCSASTQTHTGVGAFRQ